MVCDIKVRKVTQDVLMFICFKHEIISEQPSPDLRFIPEVTSELMNNLCNAVWIQSFLNDCLWEGFFRKHCQRMTSSLELFTNYVAFACYTLNENVTNAYLSFFDTLSLVSYFVLRCWDKGFKKLLNMNVEFFCAFFEKELRLKFEEEGGWEKFNVFLEDQIKERNYSHLIDANIRSFEQFHQKQDSHVEGFKRASTLYIGALEKFTQEDVETHQEAVSFADSLSSKMTELCKQTFDEILKDFAATDCQVEDFYRQSVGEASGGARPKVGKSSEKAQEIESEIVSSNITTEKKKLEGQTGTAYRNPGNDVQNSDGPNKRQSHLPPILPKLENAKSLLSEVSVDIFKLTEIVHSLCEKHGVHVDVDGKTQKA